MDVRRLTTRLRKDGALTPSVRLSMAEQTFLGCKKCASRQFYNPMYPFRVITRGRIGVYSYKVEWHIGTSISRRIIVTDIALISYVSIFWDRHNGVGRYRLYSNNDESAGGGQVPSTWYLLQVDIRT